MRIYAPQVQGLFPQVGQSSFIFDKLILILDYYIIFASSQQFCRLCYNRGMKLTSSAFENNQALASKYTCDGSDTNPPLEISDVPSQAKSLVLIMDDPDAIKPAGKIWDHWIIFNIPPKTTQILEGQEPEGVHGLGTSNNLNYHGPCPPDGQHRYFFKLYGLDTMLNLKEGVSKQVVETAMEGHIIVQVDLIATYNRN